MNALNWTDTWFTQLAGQTVVCLVLGIWAVARLERRPARAYTVLFLAMMAAVTVPLASQFVRAANFGGFLGTAPATEYLSASDRVAGSLQAPFDFGRLLVASWAVITLTLIFGIAISYVRGRRLIVESSEVSGSSLLEALAAASTVVGLRSRPQLRSHAEISSPMVWAWGRIPVVLINDDAMLHEEGIAWESIFIHELAHLARRDHITGLLADLAAGVLFWNPAAWVCRRQLAKQSEFACDEQVARGGRSSVEFAGTLLALRREALIPRIPAPSLTGGRAWLKDRVHRLLRIAEPPNARSSAGWTCVAVVATLMVVIALALMQHRSATRPDDSFAPPISSSSGL
jgi:beta-lactamase regulating signal transducer with metallopeptidase domain